MKNFSRRLLMAKRAAGLSAKELAKRAGVAERTIRTWTRGRVPKVGNLQKLANALGVSPAWLVTGKSDGKSCPSIRALRVAMAYDRLSDERQLIIDALLAEWKK